MNWSNLIIGIGALGIGGILVKILDIIWLQKAQDRAERRRWLRDKRLEAYTEIIKVILSLGAYKNAREDSFEAYYLAAESILLADNDELAFKLDLFFRKISNVYKECLRADDDPDKKSEDHLEGAYNVIIKESRELVIELRKSILQ